MKLNSRRLGHSSVIQFFMIHKNKNMATLNHIKAKHKFCFQQVCEIAFSGQDINNDLSCDSQHRM